MKNKNKVIILASIIVGVLVVTLGLTYAVLSFDETGGNSQLVLGDIWMHYNETNQLVLNDAMPMDINTYKVNPVMQSQEIGDNELGRCINIYTNGGYEFDEGSDAESFCKGTGTILDGKTIEEYFVGWQEDAKNNNYDFLEYGGQELLDAGVILSIIENLPYFEFRVDGKNTYTKKDIWYEIVLTHGDSHETRTTRIRDDLLRFTLVEVVNGNNDVIVNNKNYSNIINKRIYVDTIPANTNEEVNRTYRLYMWISEDTVIGNVNQDYTIDEWNDVFASIKVNVTGDFIEKEITTDAACFETAETFIYIPNSIMKEQELLEVEELNELTKCVLYFSDNEFEDTDDVENFCRGTATYYNGYTFQENLDLNKDGFDKSKLSNNNIIILEDDKYKVNSIMTTQEIYFGKNEITSCVNYFNSMSSNIQEGQSYENFCRGTEGSRYYTNINEWIYYLTSYFDSNKNLLEILNEGKILTFEKGLSIMAYDYTCGSSVTIPAEINGTKILEIGANAFRYTNIKDVKFSSDIKQINKNSFKGNGLTEVELPNSVIYLDCDAFDDVVTIKSEKDLICFSKLA